MAAHHSWAALPEGKLRRNGLPFQCLQCKATENVGHCMSVNGEHAYFCLSCAIAKEIPAKGETVRSEKAPAKAEASRPTVDEERSTQKIPSEVFARIDKDTLYVLNKIADSLAGIDSSLKKLSSSGTGTQKPVQPAAPKPSAPMSFKPPTEPPLKHPINTPPDISDEEYAKHRPPLSEFEKIVHDVGEEKVEEKAAVVSGDLEKTNDEIPF